MTTTRGMTLLELMIAMAITVLITMGIAAMVGVVHTGVASRHDSRQVMVRAAVAQARLDSYVLPARSVLASDATHLVLWLDDSRQSGTVHLSEVRWIDCSPPLVPNDVSNIVVHRLEDNAPITADTEITTPPSSPSALQFWESTRLALAASGHLDSDVVIIDGVAEPDDVAGLVPFSVANGRLVTLSIPFVTSDEPVVVTVSSSILLHRPPAP